VHSKQSRLSAAQAQLAGLQARVAKVQAEQRQAQARFAVVKSIATTRMNWDGTLLDLAKVLPSGVYLSNLSAAAATPSAVAATTGGTTPVFTVAGSAPSYVSTASVLDRLALLPWLTDIQLQTSARMADGSVMFSIQGTVRGGAQ
jgi:Tfp pilus assembly protein PilN